MTAYETFSSAGNRPKVKYAPVSTITRYPGDKLLTPETTDIEHLQTIYRPTTTVEERTIACLSTTLNTSGMYDTGIPSLPTCQLNNTPWLPAPQGLTFCSNVPSMV